MLFHLKLYSLETFNLRPIASEVKTQSLPWLRVRCSECDGTKIIAGTAKVLMFCWVHLCLVREGFIEEVNFFVAFDCLED